MLMSIAPDLLAWARTVVAEKKHLFHTPTGTVGRATRVWSGAEGDRATDDEATPIEAPVLEISPGHTFLLKIGAFVELEEKEVYFYLTAEEQIRSVVRVGNLVARDEKIPVGTAALLLRAALVGARVASEEG